MTALITLTTAGLDSGPFSLFSNLDGYSAAFETNISKTELLQVLQVRQVRQVRQQLLHLLIVRCMNFRMEHNQMLFIIT